MVRELAEKFGVKTGKISILPEKRCKVANATAVNHNPPVIMVTEYLWNNLNTNEKRFILAHEMAHMKIGFSVHMWSNIITSWIIVLAIALPSWFDLHPVISVVGVLVAVGLFQYLIMYPRMRNIELDADNLAISITDNPDAAISALLRLEQLNYFFNVNQRTTHPTMKERLRVLEEIRQL
jgi:Zn-dependent protease with chaperone function